jgi:hypothetical protein
MKTFLEWLQFFVEGQEDPQHIDPDDYENRLRMLGWRVDNTGSSHKMAYAPDGIGKTSWTKNKTNWEKSWLTIRRDLLKRSRSPILGYPDLEFVFRKNFQIPSNFNFATQSINAIVKNDYKTVMVATIKDLESLEGQQISHNNQWKTVKMADYGNDGNSIDVLFDDGDPVNFKLQQIITIKPMQQNSLQMA